MNDVFSLHDEISRTVHLSDGFSFTINAPLELHIRKGGKTHRVVAEDGNVYCYAAPETGKSVISWKPKDPSKPVSF